MAKISMVERQKKRVAMVDKFAVHDKDGAEDMLMGH